MAVAMADATEDGDEETDAANCGRMMMVMLMMLMVMMLIMI